MNVTGTETSAGSSATRSRSDASADKAVTSDYETFLRMLTTQLQNQDPMNPMESDDFAMQLATFSGVEQQVKTNEILTGMGASIGVMGLSELAGWIGREAEVEAPAWFDGVPLTLSPKPSEDADRAVLVVQNGAGAVVAQEDIPIGGGQMEWAGTDASGQPLPKGAYSFTVESYRGDQVTDTSKVGVYAEIIEARGGSSGTLLVMKGGIEVPASAVTALRDAS
ncbi:flagellar basal body rod modification protein [Cereibacter sphaeroides]|uniref:flagellar hook assembly protein FlgD n=1 Tax=Cereibacter sphaeroides TaxID=1063 RepID=UPI000E5BCC3B|nr:flagellar hook capping FlgD N-terminal domain-containing protein [Cereibacter sphaeroides]RHZ99672.1 flagellar basal body rod modification protein [Cereibacter sphaeroides]